MNHKNDIPYPTAEQKKRAVAQIVRQTKPPRVGAIRFLFNAYREIGMATVLRNSIGIFGLSAAVFTVGIALALPEYDPVFMELIPLSLEEIFICETEVKGYDVKKLVL